MMPRSPHVKSSTRDGFNNPKWRHAAENITMTTGAHVYAAIVLVDERGFHGRDHRGRSILIPAGDIDSIRPFIRKEA